MENEGLRTAELAVENKNSGGPSSTRQSNLLKIQNDF